MIRLMSSAIPATFATVVHPRAAIAGRVADLTAFVRHSAAEVPLSKHPLWLSVLQSSLGHDVYAVEAVASGCTVGYLPLAFVSSMLFGRFLVSLPYLNTNGVVAPSADVQAELITRATALADEFNVRYLELRHETTIIHPALNASRTDKVHMRLTLPATGSVAALIPELLAEKPAQHVVVRQLELGRYCLSLSFDANRDDGRRHHVDDVGVRVAAAGDRVSNGRRDGRCMRSLRVRRHVPGGPGHQRDSGHHTQSGLPRPADDGEA